MSVAVTADHALKGRHILIVEDEIIIAIELQMALEDAGATVETSESVAAAMRALDHKPADAAVLDVNLGQGETCAPVAERLVAAGVPFLLHTGDLHRHGELVQTIDAPVVAKPAGPEDLIAELARLLGAG